MYVQVIASGETETGAGQIMGKITGSGQNVRIKCNTYRRTLEQRTCWGQPFCPL